MHQPIRVLVVDDSPLFVEVMKDILQWDPELFIGGVAIDGKQAVEMAIRLNPDIITMDIHMPVMNGLEAIERIMADHPTPILVLTSDAQLPSDELHFEALRRGALDVMVKPNAWDATNEEKIKLRENLRFLAGIKVVRHMRAAWQDRHALSQQKSFPDNSVEEILSIEGHNPKQGTAFSGSYSFTEGEAPLAHTKADRGYCVAMVASTGGPAALAHILEALPGNFPAGIVIVQHLSHGFAPSLASWLSTVSKLKVGLAEEGAAIEPGTVWLAPDGYHLEINSHGLLTLDASPPWDGHRPSGNRLLSSAARAYRGKSIGVILTGMGHDGVQGMAEIYEAGGVTIAQDESTCTVFGMPRAAIERGLVRHIHALPLIASALCRIFGIAHSPGR